jgi:cytochrome b6-f complex iron-sulfur subunit
VFVNGNRQSSRRRFFQDAVTGVVALIAVACSPTHRNKSHAVSTSSTTAPIGEQFGASRIDAGDVDAIRASIARRQAPQYVPVARAYVSAFPAELTDSVSGDYPSDVLPVLAEGVIVLYQRCPHLGCRVPFCESSQWFECPCHSAKFDRVGEYRVGPSPRGMDLFGATIEQGRLIIDTTTVHPGLPIGTNSTHQRPEGPLCV